jgi:hypothetical protein
MAHPYNHALSSARKYGGEPEEYLQLHQWLDGSKAHTADFRHRALRHHSEGIFMLEALFGPTLTSSAGRVIPVRLIGEQHVLEDLGRIPTVQDWLGKIQPEPWMLGRDRFPTPPEPSGQVQASHERIELTSDALSGSG